VNTEELVSKEREEEIYHNCARARRDSGGVGPLSHYDFGVGFRAALVELEITKVFEVTPDPRGEDCECIFAADDFGYEDNCVSQHMPCKHGALLVRAKEMKP